MKNEIPTNFAYHDYLRQVLKKDNTSPLNIFTEDDFRKVPALTYPYRSYFYVVGLLHDGKCKIKIGPSEYIMQPRSLTLVGPGISRMWVQNDWSAANTTLFFTPDVFEKPFYNNFLIDFGFFKPGAKHVLDLEQNAYEEINKLITMIRSYETKAVRAAALYLLLEQINLLYAGYVREQDTLTPGNKILMDFNQLLQENFHEQKDVHFYADRLNVSPKQFSEIVKRETGKTAKRHIEDYVMFEAKSLLKQTEMSIKEIVYWLGFEDPSYFNRIFKSKENCTPAQYRQQGK